MENILELKNLTTVFHTDQGTVTATDNISFDIKKGQTLGVVGESGCGKSVTALSIMRLIPNPPGEITNGEVIYKGENLLKRDFSEMRKIRGNEISMIFQEPMTSLNPVFTVGDQIMESIMLHRKCKKKEALDRAIEMLKLVGISAPERRVWEYPHQLSGGMRQRVMIAMALSCDPSLLIADEPTTALDVTIQAQILDLIASLQEKLGMAVMLITHDLGVVAEVCDYVIVMYAGQVVEKGTTKDIFLSPSHPYTKGLLKSLPSLAEVESIGEHRRLDTIPGMVPDLLHLPKGCNFQARCPRKTERCVEGEPSLDHRSLHASACFHPHESSSGGNINE